jgi:hypothetical protein
MSLMTRAWQGGTRRTGLILGGLLVAGLAAATGTAMASTTAPAGMAGMTQQTGAAPAAVGSTAGWYDGETARFYYTKNYFCQAPPASHARSQCEVGADYTQTPASSFDPLYVIVPLGFTPPRSTLQCPNAGNCVDHPRTIDLSAILGAGTGNLALPPHSHIVATANGGHPEWWNVDVVGVKSLSAWNRIVHNKSSEGLAYLQRHLSSEVTGNIPTNLFLYFSVNSDS